MSSGHLTRELLSSDFTWYRQRTERFFSRPRGFRRISATFVQQTERARDAYLENDVADRDFHEADPFRSESPASAHKGFTWDAEELIQPGTSSHEADVGREWKAGAERPLRKRLSASRFRAKQSGWRLGVLTGICLSALVLCGNFILLFVGFRYSGYRDGIGILAQGRSGSIALTSTVYHILINFLSTLLLTASNYSMQVLCSPTRDDIDRAHGEGMHLNVGVLSPRNIRFMKGSRELQWYTLMITSISLHLL